MKGSVRPRDGVLGITTVRGGDLVEGGDAIAGLKLGDVGADLVYDAGNVVAFIDDNLEPFGHLPILGIGPTDDDFDADLVVVGLRDGRVDDLDLGS